MGFLGEVPAGGFSMLATSGEDIFIFLVSEKVN